MIISGKVRLIFCLVFLGLTTATSVTADPQQQANPAAAADLFGQALKAGNEAAVRSLLDENVLIFESGNVESSLAEYASHHMAADFAFMAGMEKEVLSRRVFADGDMAVVSTRYRMYGSYKGKDYDQVSSETLVMEKNAMGWKILHIHWS